MEPNLLTVFSIYDVKQIAPLQRRSNHRSPFLTKIKDLVGILNISSFSPDFPEEKSSADYIQERRK